MQKAGPELLDDSAPHFAGGRALSRSRGSGASPRPFACDSDQGLADARASASSREQQPRAGRRQSGRSPACTPASGARPRLAAHRLGSPDCEAAHVPSTAAPIVCGSAWAKSVVIADSALTRTRSKSLGFSQNAPPLLLARANNAARSRRDGSAPRYDAGEVPLRVLLRRRPPKPGVTVSDHRALQ
jgi:hypothetical protein